MQRRCAGLDHRGDGPSQAAIQTREHLVLRPREPDAGAAMLPLVMAALLTGQQGCATKIQIPPDVDGKISTY